MRFKTAFAQTPDGNPAANARVRKIREDFSGAEPVFVVFFAATDYDPDILAAEMHDAFPGAVTMGCTTAGEACGSLVLKASVVAMWMLSRKMVEQWLVWLAVDVVTCGLYIYKDIPLTAGLYGLYSVLAVMGYLRWKKLVIRNS